MRLPRSSAALQVAQLVHQAASDPVLRRELPEFLRRLPSAILRRRRMSDEVWQRWQATRSITA